MAKRVTAALWALIVDAKHRKRRPDGSLVSEEEETQEMRQREDKQREKYDVWAEREKNMAKGF